MEFENFKKKYRISLNKQQETAVQAVDGPCLLLAVPGSGKTTVLVTRLGYMLHLGIDPEKILTLTYTVAATNDMSERFSRLFGTESGLEFRTINGISSKIISFFSGKIGKVSFDLETNEGERFSRIAAAYISNSSEYPTDSDIRELSTEITYIKNMMLTDEEIKKRESRVEYPLYDIYNAYNASLKKSPKMDYDDQMVYAYKILQKSPETLEYFRNKYEYICVDEAQDTSKIQHALIKILAEPRHNIFMVGDEDQSIYGFRAAYPEALLSFEKDHPGARVLLMEENFRSSKEIVSAADTFIKKNKFRHKKNMVSNRAEVEEVHIVQVPGRCGQYGYLVNLAENCKEETAVLYRDNESVIPLVDRLDRAGLPYRIKNAELTFFSNRVVLDIMNTLKLALAPERADLFMELYYKFGAYLSKTTAKTICAEAGGKDIRDSLKRHGQQALVKKLNILPGAKPEYALDHIMTSMGYGAYLRQRHISDSKISILREIFALCTDIEDAISRMEELSFIIQNHEPSGKLILSTIHSSKGLEYKNVYIMDAINGIFPDEIPKRTANREELEAYEELRRIFYVGITRAKDGLFLFRTGNPSRFIDEMMPKKTVNKADHSFEDFCRELTKGKNVIHKKYGKGKITDVQLPYVRISFGTEEKTFGAKILYANNLLRL